MSTIKCTSLQHTYATLIWRKLKELTSKYDPSKINHLTMFWYVHKSANYLIVRCIQFRIVVKYLALFSACTAATASTKSTSSRIFAFVWRSSTRCFRSNCLPLSLLKHITKLNNSIYSGLRRNFFGTNYRIWSWMLLATECLLPNCKWKAVTSGFNSDEGSYPRRYLHGSFVSYKTIDSCWIIF